MAFGDFAKLDGYDPDAGFKDTFRERFGAAPLDPFEAAALRQRQFRNRPSETSQETIDKAAGVMSDVLIPKTPLDVAITAATLPFGGPLTRPAVRAGMLALGGILNPDAAEAGKLNLFKHGISAVKLPKPINEYSSVHTPRAEMENKVVSAEALKGKRLYPTISDTTVPNTYLEQIENYKLPERVKMSGGGRFADVIENKPDVWMSQPGPMKGLANRVDEISARTGNETLVAPTALSGTGGDYSHHVWSPLVDVFKNTKGISKAARSDFDAIMREADPNFPGVNAKRDTLQNYFQAAARGPRTTFSQAMDTRRFQDLGFPDVAAVRHAATDPELLHAPMGSSGYSIFGVDPKSVRPVAGHGTYSHGIAGENVGSLGVIAPPDIMFPDVMESLRLMSQASGKPLRKYTGRPDYYFAGRVPSELFGKPLAQSQLVDDKWLNTFGDYARRYKKVGGAAALASGMTLAEIAAAQEQDEPLRITVRPKLGDLADQANY